jgi:hypothetical protein
MDSHRQPQLNRSVPTPTDGREKSGKRLRLRSVASSSAAVLIAFAVLILLRSTVAQDPTPRIPMVYDWTHQHVVFSQPLTREIASRIQRDPRYWMQILVRNGRRNSRVDPELESGEASDLTNLPSLHRDWGQSLGAGGSTGVPPPGAFNSWVPVFPAKFTFNLNSAPDCTNDYVTFPTNLVGVSGGQASIIAYNKLYAGAGSSYCGVANPSVYWSYNTNFDATGAATTGTVQTSPVLSGDGSKLAFVETGSSGGAVVHLLKWRAGDGGAISSAVAPTIATVWTPDGLVGHCSITGACMISILLKGPASDTQSSPFYDYQRDVIYVGDDKGTLHKIINAFGVAGATPTEATGSWPIIVDPVGGNVRLTSPTLDSVSGNIFIEDSSGLLSYVLETFSAAGSCTGTAVAPCLGSTSISSSGTHVVTDPPIVDPSTEKVFVFYGNNGTIPAVIQSDVTLSTSVTASLGTGTGKHIHAGAFDNTYLTGNGGTGSLYICGASPSSSTPFLQRIGFTNSGRSPASPFANPVGTMNAAVDGVTLKVASASTECAPITELFNPNAPAATQDQIFFGVQSLGIPTNCGGGGCVLSVNVTNTPGTLAIANSSAEINGPSGIIVDGDANTTLFPQASSLYFSPQGNSTTVQPCGATAGIGCAVKLTQAGLN